MKVAATYNIKGGVGKTAAAVNLAYLASREGMRTVVWDLDPQGAATFYFRVKPKVKGGGRKLVKGKSALADAVKGTDYENLDLIPSDFSYRHLDIALDKEKKPAKRLNKLLSELKDDYDLVLLDCPPSISLVSEAVFEAADALVIPVIPTVLSLRTLKQLYRFREDNGISGLRFFIFFSMVDMRKKMHRELMEETKAKREETTGAAIPYASVVERMGVERAPLETFSGRSAAAAAYRELWREVRDGIFGR